MINSVITLFLISFLGFVISCNLPMMIKTSEIILEDIIEIEQDF